MAAIELGWNSVACPYANRTICPKMHEGNNIVPIRNAILLIDSRVVCPKLGLCAEPRVVPDDFARFKESVLHDKPPRVYPNARDSGFKYVVATDMHFSLDYTQVCRAKVDHPRIEQERGVRLDCLLQGRLARCD